MAVLTPGLAWLGALLIPLAGLIFGDEAAPGDDAASPPEIDDPDRELVQAVLDGDGSAYQGLVERYQGRIYAVVYGMVRNREDARDLAQDSFIKAYKNLHRFRLESKFYTWLCRIAMNTAIDHLRRQKLRRHDEFDDGIASKDAGGVISIAHARNDPGRNLERKQLHAQILAAMDTLPDDQRQVVVLREVEGLAYKEIAAVLDIPEGTVMSRLYYARQKLQRALKEAKGG